jgi:phosphatidylglycerol---prolipoprotein diacylglyceryl transferase
MRFPFYFEVFGLRVHPHLLMELIAYAGGFQLYLWLRRREARRSPERVVEAVSNMWVLVGCVLGALVGSKVLAWAESWNLYWAHRGDPRVWAGGKTIVGGLLGGWIGVEVAKKFLGIARSTGDLFVFPLIFGMSVGRVGCFLTGLDDRTYGLATSLPWGVDFGDGIRRHPTQLYDIVFLTALGALLWWRFGRTPWGDGRMFRWFILGYLAWRFAVEFIKPRETRIALAGVNLSAIQIASLAGAIVCATSLAQSRAREANTPCTADA